MRIDYAVSLWNYWWYSQAPSLERAVAMIRRERFGAEFHIHWHEEKNLYDEIGRERLKGLVEGMKVSLHTNAGPMEFDLACRNMIDTAAHIGAKVVVTHPSDFGGWRPDEINEEVLHEAVDHAEKLGVTIALENGGLAVLVRAIEIEPRLGICLDVGHVYLGSIPLSEYLDALKANLMHLHLQDLCTDIERDAPGAIADHYTPGTGTIPREDWELLGETLREIDFEGMAVYEIHPRDPIQTARLATEFVKDAFSNQPQL